MTQFILNNGQKLSLREAQDNDVPSLRKILNESYKELADKGLNYTATYQDEKITRERMHQGRAFVLEDRGQLIATVLFSKLNYFTGKNTAYISQLAVLPQFKKMGIGSLLMDYCENLAREERYEK